MPSLLTTVSLTHSQNSGRLVVWMVIPPCIVLLVLLVCACRIALWREPSCARLQVIFEMALPIILRALFLFYPIVTNVAFEAFSCYDFRGDQFDNRTRAFLVADVAIACSTSDIASETHETIKAVAWTAIGIYPIGLFVLVAVLLAGTSGAILRNKPTPLSRATLFLYGEYEPAFFWCERGWELPHMTPTLP